MNFDFPTDSLAQIANDNTPVPAPRAPVTTGDDPLTLNQPYRKESQRAAAFMDAAEQIQALRHPSLMGSALHGSAGGLGPKDSASKLFQGRSAQKSFGGFGRPSSSGGSGGGRPPESPKVSVKSEKRQENISLALGLWLVTLAAVLWTAIYDIAGNKQLLASIALVWTGLWIGYIGQDRQKSRFGDLGTFTAIVGFVSALFAASSKMNIPLSLVDCISVLTFVCLICSLLASSRIALILSACAALVGVYLHFQGQSAPFAMMAFPAIWATQLYQASKLRSFLASCGVILVGYYWIYGFTTQFLQNGLISTLYATTLIFLFGAFQYAAGRAAEDEHAPYALLHKLMGWTLACVGAMATQVSWLFPGVDFWPTRLNSLGFAAETTPLVPGQATLWIGLGAVMIIGIFFANLVRWKNNRIAMVGVFTATVLCTAYGFTTVFEADIRKLLGSGADAWGNSWDILSSTHIGFVMVAGVIASGMAMIGNGLRANKISLICVAALVLGAQFILIADPAFLTLGDVVIFGILFLIAVGITASVSSRSYLAYAPDRERFETPINA